MKIRIITQIDQNGETYLVAQWKGWFGWVTYPEPDGYGHLEKKFFLKEQAMIFVEREIRIYELKKNFKPQVIKTYEV